MKKYFIIPLFLFALLVTCKKDNNPTQPIKPEICDFGPLNQNSFTTKEEFDMAANGGSTKLRDLDKDGIPDINDNCPKTKNPDQKDSDKDGIGDACDQYPYGNEPSVTSVVLLDFDGYLLPSTSIWNNTGADKQCLPSGLPPLDVQTILDSVKKDYAKYNITVTTDENVYMNASVAKRMRVVITTSSEIYPAVAGVAYRNSMFSTDPNSVCFVFSNTLSYKPLRVRVCVSHETGHTVGLDHQSTYDANCVMLYTYAPCYGLTGPIMGSIGEACLASWWKGPTPVSCTTIQDDDAILTKNLGIK